MCKNSTRREYGRETGKRGSQEREEATTKEQTRKSVKQNKQNRRVGAKKLDQQGRKVRRGMRVKKREGRESGREG